MKKVISILSVIAMVLSVFAIPLLNLPVGKLPGTGKVYAAENLTGTAYAVFNSDTGELDFIRSTESHKNGDTGTVKSISGGSYTGTIYTGFEKNTKNYDASPGWFGDYPSPWRSVIEQVKTVKFIDNIKPTTTAAWFAGMKNCTSMDLKKLITSQTVDMSYMFGKGGENWLGDGCTSLTALDVSNFDTSKVTNMSHMFEECSKLTSLDLSKFNTSNVTSMYDMFKGCSGLTSLDLSKFNTSNVTDMRYMFAGCSGLTSLDVSNFNTSNVTNMSCMFGPSSFWGAGCSSLTSLNVSNFDTSKVTDMSSMFEGCSGLTSLDVSNFDTSKIADDVYSGTMSSMFSNCSSLYKLIIGKSFKVSPLHSKYVFSSPAKTISGKSSDGTWGLSSENAAKTYTADELTTLGKTAGALNGTWYAQAAGKYTIKFDPNGGSGSMANETMTVGGTSALNANAFTRTGYTFKSWNTKADGTGTAYADKASVKDLGVKDSTITLYAQWNYNPHVFLPKSGGKGVITIGLVSAFCMLAYAEREILKKRKGVKR